MSRWTVVNLPGCQWRASLRLGLPLVLTLFTALSALALDNQLKAQYDSGVYVVLATSLSMGQGYRDIFVLGDPPHTKYPPVFPLLLAPFIHAFGYNVVLLKLMVIAMAVSALYVLYRLYADEGDQGMPLVLALAAATSPGVVFFSQSVMTEVPYLLLSLLALLALHRYSPPASGAALAIIAGLLSLAYLTRLVGLSARGRRRLSPVRGRRADAFRPPARRDRDRTPCGGAGGRLVPA